MIRLLLVGCGKIATLGHLPALMSLREEGLVDVVACDVDATKAQNAGSQFGIPWVTDWTAAANDVDALAVCVPPGLNAEIAAAGAGMGLHVLCEKPPGRRLAHARLMAAAADDAAESHPGTVTMVAFNRRFNGLYQRALTQSYTLGPPTSFYGRFSRNQLGGSPDDTLEDWITSSSSHALDLAVATMGYPSAVSVSRRRVGAGPDNVWTVQLHADQGSALLLFHYAAGRRVEHYEWAGPDYDVSLDLPLQAHWAQSGRPAETWTAENDAYHHAGGFTDEYRAFLAAINRESAPPPCDFSYGLEFMRLVDTILGAGDGSLQAIAPGGMAEQPSANGQSHREGRGSGPRVPDSRPVVLIQHPLPVRARFFGPSQLDALQELCDVRVLEATKESPASGDDARAWKEANVVITGRGSEGFADDIVSRSPDLRLVVALGASVQSLPTRELLAQGVTVCNTAGAVARSVAEHCLMVALAGLRDLPRIDRAMHRGEWPQIGDQRALLPPSLQSAARRLPVSGRMRALLKPGASRLGGLSRRLIGGVGHRSFDLGDAVVGLAGWGHTARCFAELLQPFGCEILVATESAGVEELASVNARPVSLHELLVSCRVISLHKGLTDRTRGLLGVDELAVIRPGSVLVNSARGALIDERALLARLAQGDIVAALDVYAEEPLPKHHPLRKLPNAILTPHHASTTAGEARRMGDEAVATVLAWAAGEPVPGIDETRLARMT